MKEKPIFRLELSVEHPICGLYIKGFDWVSQTSKLSPFVK